MRARTTTLPRLGRSARLLIFASLGSPAVLLAQAQMGSAGGAPAGGPAASVVKPAGRGGREQWSVMTPEDKKSMRETYELLFRDLSPEQRERLFSRLRGMSPEERRDIIEVARARVRDREKEKRPEPERAPADDPEREKRIDRNLRLWEERLPPHLKEVVRQFSREEKLRFFRAYRESQLLARTFAGKDEKEALVRMGPRRRRALLKPAGDAPQGISAASWERWKGLRPGERMQLLRRLDRIQIERDRPAAPAAGGVEASAPASAGAPRK